MYLINNLNDPSSGLLDNDRNQDGVPDFIFPMSELDLKVKTYKTLNSLHEDIGDGLVCFGISISD